MKRKVYFLIVINICVLLLFLLSNNSLAINTDINPTASTNIKRGLIRKSSLTPLDNGYMRVFYDSINKNIGIEYYDTAFKILKKSKLDLELPIYGGFYAGNDAYYLIEGQNNTDEDDNLEVIRMIKYDTNWNRLGAASITGNTSIDGEVRYPFDAGNVEMTEVDNKIYIVTGHEGYVDSAVGQGHQGYLMIEVDKNTLTGKIVEADLYHSFSQYIEQNDSNMYVLELSEGARYTKLTKYDKNNIKNTKSIPIFNYGGKRTSSWAVECYASVNGLAISKDNILSIGTSIDQEQYDNASSSTSHNIYLTVTPVNDFSQSATTTKWLTNYADDGKSFAGLEITKINDNRFMILWEEWLSEYGELEMVDNDTLSVCKLHYLFVDGNGEKISEEYTANASISDCRPFVKDGKVIYYASNGNMVDFYTIDSNNGNFEKVMYRVAGENITWNLDENGVLYLTGKGKMFVNTDALIKPPLSKITGYSYSKSENSWKPIKENVKKLIISEDITSIADEEFTGFGNLSEISIPDSLEQIGKSAFRGFQGYRNVYLSKNITNIGEDAFWSGYYRYNDEKVYWLNVYTQKGSYAESWANEKNITCKYVEDLDFTDNATKVNLKVVGEATVKFTVESIEEENTDYKDMKNKVSDKLVLSAYNISKNNKMCFGNNKLTFKVGKNFKDKNVTILQKKQNGTINLEEKKVDSNGNVTITTDELSSFMIVIDKKDVSVVVGDINGDGKVNGMDWTRLYEHVNETNKLNDYQLLCADVNGDGKVNGMDWTRLYEHINEINPLF